MKDRYCVLVTDIGAFTTDFGYVQIDTSLKTDDWNIPLIRQKSERLGLSELDMCVSELLDPEVRNYFAEQPTEEWERRKQALYSNRPQRMLIHGKSMTIGADFEAEAIQDEIRRFAKRVVNARERFCQQQGLTDVDEEMISGGGTAIPLLREALVSSIRHSGRRVHDLWDPAEPEEAIAAGAGRMTEREKDERVTRNRWLIRGGSAIGGASVFFESPAAPIGTQARVHASQRAEA
jgi:molecular chaperone DnaK (HSP70)